jgi:hypothetical protein
MVHQRGPKKTGKPFLKPGQRSLIKSERRALQLFGGDLQDAKEEAFIRMVCDGLSLGVSYVRAGFTSKASHAARNLFNEPRIQRRAEAVLEARRTQGVVTLPEVTDMLKRVFAGANSEGEYSAAHNAAFSLARLYGHVTDKATLEVMRRPSREPDAPSEQVLGDWVASLPGPTIDALPVASDPSGGPLRCAPAGLLGLETKALPEINGATASLEGSGPGARRATRGMEIENGAPVGPVIGTPTTGRRSPPSGKRVPSEAERVPVKKRVKSAAAQLAKRKQRKLRLRAEMKDLFG